MYDAVMFAIYQYIVTHLQRVFCLKIRLSCDEQLHCVPSKNTEQLSVQIRVQ